MTLSEKIAALRKEKDWSQEELAEKLGVTRQAVSKWESAASMPDMEKIVQLSNLFAVSTDYLLKAELETRQTAAPTQVPAEKARRVTLIEAKKFLGALSAAIPRVSLGVALCVWSPIVLIGLGAIGSVLNVRISEAAGTGLGLCVLLVMVAAGVALFLTSGAKLRAFEYLEHEPIEADADAKEFALCLREEQAALCAKLTTVGVVLCIVSAVPIFAVMCAPAVPDGFYTLAVCALLGLVGIACLLLVRAGMLRGGVDRILEQGDYTREGKARQRLVGAVSACYWLIVTAVFLYYTFGPNGNGQPQYSWVIWAIAGVLYGALMAGLSIYRKKAK